MTGLRRSSPSAVRSVSLELGTRAAINLRGVVQEKMGEFDRALKLQDKKIAKAERELQAMGHARESLRDWVEDMAEIYALLSPVQTAETS
jgi:hypothetical protein